MLNIFRNPQEMIYKPYDIKIKDGTPIGRIIAQAWDQDELNKKLEELKLQYPNKEIYYEKSA